MASVYKVGNKFHVAWMEGGKRLVARGIPNRKMADQLAAQKEFGKTAAAYGLVDPALKKLADEADRPMPAHLDEFEKTLKADGGTPKHVAEQRKLVERVLAVAEVTRIDRMDRHKLKVAIDSMPQQRGKRELSARSKNKAMGAVKSFAYFLMENDRIARNPLAREKGLNEELDRRRVRVSMTEEQAVHLIETTATQKARGGMTGEERMIRYALGIGSGLRQGTLFALKPDDFHLVAIPPFIRVPAGIVKGRKSFDQPIREDLAALLSPWLEGRKRGVPVFPKLPHAKPINAYKQDLKAAGIVYNETDTNLYCDQHAQRNHYITAVIRAAGLKVAQDLARHSTPNLTSKYGRMETRDYARGLSGLPPLKRAKTSHKKSG